MGAGADASNPGGAVMSLHLGLSIGLNVTAGGSAPALTVYSLDNNHYEASQTLQSVTITDQGAPYDGTHDLTGILTGADDDIGWFVDPFRTGTEGVGNTLIVNKGLWVSEGEDSGLSETNVVRYWDDQTVIATNVTLPYEYVQQAGDDTRGIEIIFTASNPTNSAQVKTDIVVSVNAPAIVSASNVTPTVLNSNEFGDGKTYHLYEWNTAGTFNGDITFSQGGKVRVLLVGGGGGGGMGEYEHGGGGGAGDLYTNSAFIVTAGAKNIVVGAGGVKGTNTVRAGSGGDTTFEGITALGGGSGAIRGGGNPAAADGGSGGGGCQWMTEGGTGVGYNANDGGSFTDGVSNGLSAAGGGGAGGVGQDAQTTNTLGGEGGIGLQDNITGTNVYYAGGGAGGARFDEECPGGLGGGGTSRGETYSTPFLADDGADGFGGGGGSGYRYFQYPAGVSGAGGCGTVKILVEVI